MVVSTNIVGANAERARGHNRQMVLNRIRTAGLIGRAEIARASGLTTQAVSNIIADLLADGLIAERGRKAGVRGQPPVQYGLNPHGRYAIGLEIRPDAIFAAVLDFCGVPVASLRMQIKSNDLRTITDAVGSAKEQIIEKSGIPVDRALGVGVVMPGPFGRTGISGTGSEIPALSEVVPSAWLRDAIELPIVVENDANAAAIAERVSGVAQGLESFAFLYFGTGLGLGIVENGRLVTGSLGNAGEIGHIPIQINGETKALEAVLSRLSVQRYLLEAGVRATSFDDVAEAYDRREPAMLDWLKTAEAALGQAVSIVENMLDPETIVLGGAMPDGILDHLVAAKILPEKSPAHRPDRTVPRVLRGASGRMMGTHGAAALVLNQAFTPRISENT